MRKAVVIDAVRTPVGRAAADKGYFRDVRAEDLSAHVMQAILKRTGISPADIEDVRWGCVQQQGEQGFDVARIAAMVAGLPEQTGGVTINRNCGSSLQAINDSAMSIAAGCEDVQIAGGVEHMEHVPMNKDYNPCPSLFKRHSEAIMNMGLTAEYLAAKYRIPRGRQDEFALRSHQLAATRNRRRPVRRRDHSHLGARRSRPQGPAHDRPVHPPRDHRSRPWAALPPAFNPDGGSVTAGNSSPINVGAAALLVMSEEKARELGQKPIAWIRAMAVAGVNPEEMGIGPVPAVGESPQAGGPQARSDRLHRAQRGVRRSGPVGSQAARYQGRQGQHARRGHRNRPSLGGQRRPDRNHAASPDARPGCKARAGDHVHRPGAGRRHDL